MLTNSKQISGSDSERNCNLRGIINCNTSNVIDQLPCEDCPKDFIGKTIAPLRNITINHQFHLFHWNSERPVLQHTIVHKNKVEGCYLLQGLHHLNERVNQHKLRNVEVAHQLILKVDNLMDWTWSYNDFYSKNLFSPLFI